VAFTSYSSSAVKPKTACSICMYSRVLSRLAWPRNSLTRSMFLVWWYRLVAFQCLKVCRLILRRRGFWSFAARLLRLPQKTDLMTLVFGLPNMY